MNFRGDSRTCAFASRRTVFADDTRPATLVVKDQKIEEIFYDTGEDVARYLSEVSTKRGAIPGRSVSEVSRHPDERSRLVSADAWNN